MYLCMFVSVFKYWHSWGAVPIPVEKKEKDQGGSYEASIQFTHLGGLKRRKLQIAGKSVDRCH